jgi:hemerythrin
MTIVWRDQMSIDGGMIDDDHKCLIGLVNALESIPSGPAMSAEVKLIMSRLCRYAQVHFEREERLQTVVAFPYQQAHHRDHMNNLRGLQALSAECETVVPSQMAAFRARLCSFMSQWIRDHIFEYDLVMKPFVAEIRLRTQATVALAEAVRLDAAKRETERAKAYGQLPGLAAG